MRIGDRVFELPPNPFNGSPILLLPREILRDLPVAESWSDIDYVIAFNAELRQRVNALIGTALRKAGAFPKGALRARLLRDPDVFAEIIKAYRKTPARPYDFEADILGAEIWAPAVEGVGSQVPARPRAACAPDHGRRDAGRPGDLLGVRPPDRERRANRLSVRGPGRPRHESFAQRLLQGVAHSWCKANDLDISAESGRAAAAWISSSRTASRPRSSSRSS